MLRTAQEAPTQNLPCHPESPRVLAVLALLFVVALNNKNNTRNGD